MPAPIFFFFYFPPPSPQCLLKGHEAFKELSNSRRESNGPEPGAGRWQEGALRYSLSFELCRYVHPCSIHPEEGHRAEIEQGYVN